MEKLIELLNEYIPEWWSIEHWGKSVFYEWLNYNDRIIWKDFWFIKWLVENDKINIDSYTYSIWVWKIWENNEDWRYDEYSDYEKTLMLLAIQDEPIDFLISMLK